MSKNQIITVVVVDGSITDVVGVPKGVTVRIIDADFSSPVVHLYKAGNKEVHRKATVEEDEEFLGTDSESNLTDVFGECE